MDNGNTMSKEERLLAKPVDRRSYLGSYSETDEEINEMLGSLKTKEELMAEIDRIDQRIIDMHKRGFNSRKSYTSSPRSELLKIKRSFLFKRLCEFEEEEQCRKADG